ncbi:GNAT family N-acetyltransferase/peptidase C39 family protein [Catenovulum sp. 2E275]|uniref:GNAT family N-acetyltransferase/peptidase C39 family protein n=1 Tax=Catenovulum sp. 2E275 TaxID=2980497 RepID=UPI0021D0FB88|nr:GNAT family N-acetyltransferase/peptidase C39 family protein [Catenovulum sp. 2E275]MCU4675808.1 GNAT family N-acetyltransferase/peptidase C39 family protein [Catenovulum sp. 2E275]
MNQVIIRPACPSDLSQLNALEQTCFKTDRLSKRRLKHWISAANGILLVAEVAEQVQGYALLLLHKGSVLARLYSIAVHPEARGLGIAGQLINSIEQAASQFAKLYIRLEVAKQNETAIKLYQNLGYKVFDVYLDYYEDHQDALRMQKRLYYKPNKLTTPNVPWYQQTTEFTCGPAACMMAMSALCPTIEMGQALELDIWREATTIYMTSGHGGCHPIGLALAVEKRGFKCELYLNQSQTLFLDGVRNPHKREIMTTVDQQFRLLAEQTHLQIHQHNVSQEQLQSFLEQGKMLVILISSYRFDGKKAPHWVTISGVDDNCFYLHDPDPQDDDINHLACQYLPITKQDFAKMTVFGKGKLSSVLVISK